MSAANTHSRPTTAHGPPRVVPASVAASATLSSDTQAVGEIRRAQPLRPGRGHRLRDRHRREHRAVAALGDAVVEQHRLEEVDLADPREREDADALHHEQDEPRGARSVPARRLPCSRRQRRAASPGAVRRRGPGAARTRPPRQRDGAVRASPPRSPRSARTARREPASSAARRAASTPPWRRAPAPAPSPPPADSARPAPSAAQPVVQIGAGRARGQGAAGGDGEEVHQEAGVGGREHRRQVRRRHHRRRPPAGSCGRRCGRPRARWGSRRGRTRRSRCSGCRRSGRRTGPPRAGRRRRPASTTAG